jgi:uncharacterized protein (TIGR03437 family)
MRVSTSLEKILAAALLFDSFSQVAAAQVCRISIAGLNRSRRVTGPVHAECPGDLIHTAPFGNWGVTSNFGQKGDSHQFDGWCHDAVTCDNAGLCTISCRDGWYEWNSCTDHPLYRGPNCSLYNSTACTEQVTSTGINVHGTRVIDVPVSCPRDTNADGIPDAGGCMDVPQYSSGTNFMSLYELDPVCCDQLVQTVYFSPVTIPLSCDSLGCAPAASAWLDPSFWDSPASPAKVSAQMAVIVNWGAFVNAGGRCLAVPAASASIASAASFKGPNVAPGSIATVFGSQLSPTTERSSSVPLPSILAGVSVAFTDGSGRTLSAPLFYVSPQQVNLQVPAGLQPGPATVTVTSSGATRATGRVQIETTAPGIFTQNANGEGVPAAFVVHASGNGSMVTEPVFQCGAQPGSCEPVPIGVGPQQQPAYLILFGTGIRNRESITDISVSIGPLSLPVEYAGPQGQFVGLDQVNVFLPPELAALGTVDLTVVVNSQPSNTVRVNFR